MRTRGRAAGHLLPGAAVPLLLLALEASAATIPQLTELEGTFELEPGSGTFRAETSLTIRNPGQRRHETLTFWLHGSWQVEQVRDSQGPLEWARGDGWLDVELRAALAPGDTAEVTVAYRGAAATSHDRGGEVDEIAIAPASFSHPTLPGFFRSQVEIRVPAGWTAHTNGVRTGARYTNPASAGVAVLATRTRQPIEGERVTLLPLPEHADLGRDRIAWIERSLRMLERYFGPAPASRVTVIEVGSLALSRAFDGLVFLDDRVLPRYVDGWHPGTIEHELAHLWWAKHVRSHDWLEEGIATYAQYLVAETLGEQDAAVTLLGSLAVAAAAEAPGRTILEATMYVAPTVESWNRIQYCRGALVHHRFRRLLGDARYFGLLREVLAEYAHRSIGLRSFFELAARRCPDVDVWRFYQRFIENDFDVRSGRRRLAEDYIARWRVYLFLAADLLLFVPLAYLARRRGPQAAQRRRAVGPLLAAAGLVLAIGVIQSLRGVAWLPAGPVLSGAAALLVGQIGLAAGHRAGARLGRVVDAVAALLCLTGMANMLGSWALVAALPAGLAALGIAGLRARRARRHVLGAPGPPC